MTARVPRRKRRRERSPVALGGGIVAGGLLLLAVAFGLGPFGGRSGTHVRVDFDRAADLRAGNPVRIDGVDVGTVGDIRPAGTGPGVIADLYITSSVQVHSDARADVYWRTLLGHNVYVQVDPGTSAAPLLGNATIPLSRTHTQVTVDEALGAFTPRARRGLQLAPAQIAIGFSGADAAQALTAGPAWARDWAPAMDALRGTRAGDLPHLTSRLAATTGSLGADEQALAGLIDDSRIVLGVTAARRADLGSAIDMTPGAMGQLTATMRTLPVTLSKLDTVIAAAKPATPALSPAIGATQELLGQADPLLRSARPLLAELTPILQRLGRDVARPGTPAVHNLTTTFGRVNNPIVPALGRYSPDTRLKLYEAIGPTISAIDGTSTVFDSNGHMVSFEPGAGERPLSAAPCYTMFTDPTAKQKLVCDQTVQILQQVLGGGPSSTGGGR
jgi:virulence factor Mce-like protein